MDKQDINENIQISDSVKATTWLSPVFYKSEYDSHKEKFFTTEEDKHLILAYIFLQFYLENHFHYYLRFLIGGGFGAGVKVEDWKERDYADSKLERFEQYLLEHGFEYDDARYSEIVDNFRVISSIRNLFIHGHQVTQSTSKDFIENSPAKEYLNRQKFNETRKLANSITDNWNHILYQLQSQSTELNNSKLPSKDFFDNCKFEIF